jgi:hypothetical protein
LSSINTSGFCKHPRAFVVLDRREDKAMLKRTSAQSTPCSPAAGRDGQGVDQMLESTTVVLQLELSHA